jgi:hypothetical protein
MAKNTTKRGQPAATGSGKERSGKVAPPPAANKPGAKAGKGGKAAPPAKGKGKGKGKGAKAEAELDEEGRRLGLRGAAPWAARHAAKHAAEARARNAEPPRPGSARATLRVPEQADRIKASISELHNLTSKIRSLKKTLHDSFYEMGELLGTIRDRELYIAKGYSTFESFVEREIDMGKTATLRLERIPRVFRLDAAREYGLEALFAAIGTLEDSRVTGTTPALPMKPPTGGGKR